MRPAPAAPVDHSAHNHEVGPAALTTCAGSTAKQIWRDQAQEIKAMGQWRKAWYPEAPVYPVALKTGGDPNSMKSLERMSAVHFQAMQMMGSMTCFRFDQRLGMAAVALLCVLQLPNQVLAHAKGHYKTQAEAEQRAKELGCKGTHQNKGLWMPCSGEAMLHKELRQE